MNFVEMSMLNKGANSGRFALEPVSGRAAADIKAITGVDTEGFKTVMEQRAAEHIVDRHGLAGAANTSMSDLNDIARMQYVINNYDSMESAGKATAYTTMKSNGKPGLADTVRYIKKVNGTYYVVEAVPDTKAKTAYIVSAYMTQDGTKKAGVQHPVLADDIPTLTSKNADANTPVTNSIPQTSENDNQNNSQNATYPQGTGAMSAQFGYDEAPTQSTAQEIIKTETTKARESGNWDEVIRLKKAYDEHGNH